MIPDFILSKDYSDAWIENFNSNNDEFRIKNIDPFLKEKVEEVPNDAKILDVGCGWGTLIQFIKSTHSYVGVDPNNNFFEHIKKRFDSSNLELVEGFLPNNVFVKGKFDLVVCSMALHLTEDLQKSIEFLVSKLNENGKLILIDFSDDALGLLEEEYVKVYERKGNYIRGVTTLPTGISLENQTYLHKEKDFETIFDKMDLNFEKKPLGEIFVSWEISK